MFGLGMRVKNLMGFVADNEMENLTNILSGLRMTLQLLLVYRLTHHPLEVLHGRNC